MSLAPRLFLVLLTVSSAACRTDSDKPEGDEGGLATTGFEDEDGDGFSADEDCNDADASVSPAGVEVCDGLDNNCDGAIDEGVTSPFFTDADGDGYGDAATEVLRCAPEPGEVTTFDDCDDTDAGVYPGAPEVCDGADQDCDGVSDNGLLATYYLDRDSDGYGDPEAPVDACAPPDDAVDNASDCDDTDPSVSPDGVETCNERDDDCDTEVDEGVTTTYFRDDDTDGYGQVDDTTEACAVPAGYAELAGDCDDTDALVSPDGTETCNSIDDNCDGTVDEATATDAPTWYADADADGYGDAADSSRACSAPSGTVSDATDCDDTDSAVSPAATEVCNSIDDNCDGTVDEASASDALTWYADADTDGFGDAASPSVACSAPAGTVSDATDCDDADSAVFPGATELCNSVDDNCDGTVDEASAADASTWYADDDADGYGDPADTSVACTAPAGSIADSSDCDDTDAAVSPVATEVCNSIDDDCDGAVDDDDAGVDLSTGSTFYADLDGDGFGDASDSIVSCAAPTSYVSDATDCDDTEVLAYPGAPEPCSTIEDLDCDGSLEPTCTSCMEVLADGASTGDGVYTIDPDGAGGYSPVDTWCDMSTDGGGWTMVQRTVWDWSESSQLDTTQSQWAGTTYGDPATGFAYRMAGDLWPELQVDVEHMLVHTPRDASSGSDCDDLFYIGTGGTYTVSSSATTLSAITAGVTFVNNTTLSTSNSGPSQSCVNTSNAVPWFYSSCCTTCPTFQGSYWSDEPHPMASYIDGTPDEYGLVTGDVCPSGAAVVSFGYEGINAMAYFVR